MTGGVACMVYCADEWVSGPFRCSLYLSPKVLEVSPMYSVFVTGGDQ